VNSKKQLKDTAVKYKGGECVNCGYKRCMSALHFHHLNPHEKDFNISSKTNWNNIVIELEKCVLLCSNCHCEAHEGIIHPETLIYLEENRND